ncbi:MAG: hypothetical protein BGO25_10425 [Acidobacteriales bacterium 59-55]|nr:hypothetical protein [Terriglobales bacterium]OJV43599.1 MAG: hypothetical protein BGO25_10425 [Acidobacteriales bacterium 59-55]
MSRHEFRLHDDADKTVTVVLGYDRPLDYLFCTVVREGEEDSPLYSNFDDDEAGLHQQDINYFRTILSGLGIDLPEQMFLEVEADQLSRVGNREVDHTPSRS